MLKNKNKIKRFGWFMAGFLLMMGTYAMAAGGGAIVTDHYHEVVYLEPYSVEVCSEEQIVVGSQADIVNGAIWGAIFGAVVGDAIDDEGGRVPGAVIGALIGAGLTAGSAIHTNALFVTALTRHHQQCTMKGVWPASSSNN